MSPSGAGPGKVNLPLPPKSTLTLGYGDDGIARASRWQYIILEGRKKSLRFYKLFLYTSPTDLSSIRQESPFSVGSPYARRPTVLAAKAWATKLLAFKLIQGGGIHWHGVKISDSAYDLIICPEWWIGWFFFLLLAWTITVTFLRRFFWSFHLIQILSNLLLSNFFFVLVFGQGVRFLVRLLQ